MQVGSVTGGQSPIYSGSYSVKTEDGAVRAKSEAAPKVDEKNQNGQEEKERVDENVAVAAMSSQGDDLKVTRDGMQSQAAGGTVQEQNEDGVVARKDEVRVTTNADAAKILREQVEAAKEKANEDRLTGNEDEDEDEAAYSQDVSLIGKTKQQVEQLYRNGDISRYEYDQNMQQREEKQAANQVDAEEEGNVIEQAAGSEEAKIQNKAIFTAYENGNEDVMNAALNLAKTE